jgi:GT2 family glycosyltransferase
MTISVVIATYNRRDLLDECLGALGCQQYEPGDQVVVVDNGSTDGTAAVIATHARRFRTPLIHLEERRPGKSRALATAVPAATGDILAFTDDDVLVAPDWIEAIRAAMADPAIALVGGPVAPRWERQAPAWLRATREGYGRLGAPLALLDYGSAPIELGPRTLLGANLAIRREVFTRTGGFPLHLGKRRGTLLSGEDHDLCQRVQMAGFRALYSPAIRVRHWVPAERMRLGYYLSWFYWSGITNAALEADTPRTGRRVAGVPLYLVRRATIAAFRAATAAITGRTNTAVHHAVELAFAAGYAGSCRGGAGTRPEARPTEGGA